LEKKEKRVEKEKKEDIVKEKKHKQEKNKDDIYFNSRSKAPYYYLSNFYGDVEFEYIKLRFKPLKLLNM